MHVQINDEDVAIVGMACRLAGGNNRPEDLWESMMNKRVASSDIPDMRWEPYHRRDRRNTKALNETTKRGYFLDNLEAFDNTFFGISPKEAVLIDPQQRISLEVAWEALEDAGIPPQNLRGSNTAVFMGVNSDDYSKLLLEDIPGIEAWMGIGTAYCGVPNRISYALDLRGPSSAVDGACASSLVAVHHGRQSLLTKEADLAIVGGVNALIGPGLTCVLDKAGAISKDGTCRSFDDMANGYGRGEGTSLLILKRMSDAIRQKDRILAVLKGSAVGHDGRTNGIMAPNGLAQESVAHHALRNIDPTSIQYVEAHATSTSVGDPVEITAMSNVYGSGRTSQSPCYIGSVKPNVGHLEAGAGAVGVIKAVLALRKEMIPPQANLRSLNQKIDWGSSGLCVPFATTPWPETQLARRAAVCSYGYGGTVSHAILEAAPETVSQHNEPGAEEKLPSVFLLSAPQQKRLSLDSLTLRDWLSADGRDTSITSIAATLATRRAHHDFRAAFVISSREEVLEMTQRFSTGALTGDISTGRTFGKTDNHGAVWLFSGHGAQWLDMGKDLLLHEPIFRESVQNLESVIQTEQGFSALQALTSGSFDGSDKIQVLTFVVQVSLATTLMSKGAQPSAIMGHSVGEIAASVVAGALTPSEGALVVCRRAALYRTVMGLGAMVLINLPFKQISEALAGREDITASIDSSPNSCVVSGTTGAIEEFTKHWEGRGVKVLQVKSDIYFHSPLLNPLKDALCSALTGAITPKTPIFPLYSTTLQDARGQAPRDGHYWVQNMLQPVLLNTAIQAVADDGYRVFLEVSSHPIISHSVNETLMEMGTDDFLVIPTLFRNKPTQRALLKSLVTMWCKGVSIDWQMLFSNVDWADNVPKTTWMHQNFWKTIGTGSTHGTVTHDVHSHTLLGHRVPVPGERMTIFTTTLEESTKPFPGDHPLHGTEIVPAAVLFNTFFHATGATTLRKVHLRMPVTTSTPRDIQVLVQGDRVRIMSLNQDSQADPSSSWQTHTSATVADAEESTTYGSDIDIAEIKARIGSELKTTFSIDYLANVGVSAMGFPWAVTEHFGNTKEMLARVDVAPSTDTSQSLPWSATSWAPIFDAATSIGSTIFYETPRLRMPAEVACVGIRKDAAPPNIGYIHVQEASKDKTMPAVDVTIADEAGRALCKFTSMRFSEIGGTPGASSSVQGLVHQVAWTPARLLAHATSFDHVVLVGSNSNHLMNDYERQLIKRRIKTTGIDSAAALSNLSLASGSEVSIVMYLPDEVESVEQVYDSSSRFCIELLSIVQHVASRRLNVRVFAVTDNAIDCSATFTALAHAPLVGLSRIIAAEQPELWGGLIDVDSSEFPYQSVKYISGADIIKVEDSVAKVSRLRALPQDKLYPPDKQSRLYPRAEGTYVLSGGLGSLGLEVAAFLVERGARRIVLISRRALPARSTWASQTGSMLEAVTKVQNLERAGATVYSLDIDLAAPGAATTLAQRLEALSLPPVLGVVHAAGVLEDQLILSATPEAVRRVLAPKVAGALALHGVFPPGTLDFFIMFSSCGQFFGFPGQGSYASGNAFLDGLAEHRRSLGDNAIALQWTSWRGMGMVADSDFIEAELESKGITSITPEDAFRAWDHVAKYNVSHAVILRTRMLDANELLPMDILEEITVRSTETVNETRTNQSVAVSSNQVPPEGPGRIAYLTTKIAECVASVLDLPNPGDVDPKAALQDLGMDSVMTVALRRKLQTSLGVKMPPTLVWDHPTVSHLAKWFAAKVT